jgi:hypothetical protein
VIKSLIYWHFVNCDLFPDDFFEFQSKLRKGEVRRNNGLYAGIGKCLLYFINFQIKVSDQSGALSQVIQPPFRDFKNCR